MMLSSLNFEPDAVEDQPKSIHLSRKDMRNILVALAALMVVMLPVYQVLKRGRDKHLCIQNLRAVGYALELYAIDNTDRLPPLYATDDGSTPRMYGKAPLTWMSVVADRMDASKSLVCPSADASEYSYNVNPGIKAVKGPLPSTYGMFGAWSAFPRSYVSNPAASLLVSETSNAGSAQSYNPSPFKDSQGQRFPYDGFCIGLDTTNFTPAEEGNDAKLIGAKLATRLAFRNTAQGDFGSGAIPRHDGGLQALNADLQLVQILPGQAHVKRMGSKPDSTITGLWQTR